MGILNKIFGGSKEPSPRVQGLMGELRSDDPAVRKAACEALGELGGEAELATELLEELIQDQDGDVCMAAAAAISKVVRGF
jgi:HEAT repeat protein